MKFNIGDKVIVKYINKMTTHSIVGKIGIINNIFKYSNYPYRVRLFPDLKFAFPLKEDEIELVNQEPVNEYEEWDNNDINEANINWDEELILASYNGHLDIVKYLVDNGANVNYQNNYGYTILMMASFNNKLDIVKYLVDNGANINIQTNNGYTVLMWASYKGHLDIVKYLVEQGANIDHQNKYGDTALYYAKGYNHQDIIDYLENPGPIDEYEEWDNDDINEAKQINWDEKLLNVSRNGQLNKVKQSIEQGANVNYQNEYGNIALIWASVNGHLNIVKYLVEHGANIDIQDNNEYTALDYVKKYNHRDIIDYLENPGPIDEYEEWDD